MSGHVVYLHGFGSSPQSAKAAMLRAGLGDQALSFSVPQLDGGDFTGLTMDLYRERATAAVAAVPDDGTALLVVGSSLGGYTAALLAAEGRLSRASALLLIAPAFGFTDRWRELLGEDGMAEWRGSGERLFFHHGADCELPLGCGFLESCERLPAIPAADLRPLTVVQGRRDETVDWRGSLAYAQQAPQVDLHLVDDDHALASPKVESLLRWCARDLMTRAAAPTAMPH
jgi:pimeloyl-ACP methyl ester carboxylesterase